MAKRRKKARFRILLLLLLLWAAYRYLDVTDRVFAPPAAEKIQGEWRAHGEEYEGFTVDIDADSVRVYEGRRLICDEEYSLNERTMLITGAYRQDFGCFALFEYRDGEDGVNGEPMLVGNAILPDGGYEEIWFSKE